jgi:hypothetical protein
MSITTWRERAAPIVARVLRETKGKPEREVRAALREAYPFGERTYWPYKVWLDEVARQRGTRRPKARKGTPKRAQQEADDRTLDLFGGGASR